MKRLTGPRLVMRGLFTSPSLESIDTSQTEQQKPRRGQHEHRHREDKRQSCCDQRADQCPAAPSRRNDSEQSRPLLGCEEIGHEAPEHGHDQQIDHREPHEKAAGHPLGIYMTGHQHVVREQVRNNEPVHHQQQSIA